MIEAIQPFLISFGIGFLIGIERERSHPAGIKAFGVRTFVLFALLGTLAAYIDEPLITITLSLFVFAAILLAYFRYTDTRKQTIAIGLTTEISAAVIYCLGYIAASKPFIAITVGVAVFLILLGRKHLHTLAREKIKPEEIQATAVILILSLGVLSFLPDHTIDPWNLFNPRKFGVLVILLALMQFGGYIAIRIFGSRLGMLFMGFFGGLISSTVVYATLPRFSRENPELLRPTIVAAVFAVIGMLIELIIIIFVAAPSLIIAFTLPMLTMLIIGASSAILMVNHKSQKDILQSSTNPLDLKSVLKIAAFIGGMLLLVTISKRFFGIEGMQLVTFFGGLFELHSVSLATAILFAQQQIGLNQAVVTLWIAIFATFTSKLLFLWTLARNRFALITSLYLFAMLAGGIIVFVLVNGVTHVT